VGECSYKNRYARKYSRCEAGRATKHSLSTGLKEKNLGFLPQTPTFRQPTNQIFFGEKDISLRGKNTSCLVSSKGVYLTLLCRARYKSPYCLRIGVHFFEGAKTSKK
jgi:hypothetical protein